MRRDIAERIVETVKKMDDLLGVIHEITLEMDDESERRALRRAIADLVCDLHEKITLTVAKQYPDLHPDRAS